MAILKHLSTTARLSGAMACITTMLFIVVSTSPEFGNFSPVPVDSLATSVGALVLGLVATILTHGMSNLCRIALLGLYIVGPSIGYGGFLTSLWVSLGGWELIDVFVVVAGQRVFAQMITTGAISAVAVALALLVLPQVSIK